MHHTYVGVSSQSTNLFYYNCELFYTIHVVSWSFISAAILLTQFRSSIASWPEFGSILGALLAYHFIQIFNNKFVLLQTGYYVITLYVLLGYGVAEGNFKTPQEMEGKEKEKKDQKTTSAQHCQTIL